MSTPIAIPFLLAAAVAFAFAIPAFLHPDPAHPDFPWFLACPAASSALLSLSILTNIFTLPRQKMATIKTPDATEFLLLPRQLRSERLRNALTLFVAIGLPAAFLAAHVEILHRPYAHALATVLGLIPPALLGIAAPRALALHRLGELQLTLSVTPIHLNEPFTLTVKHLSRTPAQITELRARLLCFEHNLVHTGRYVQLVVKQRDEVIVPLAKESTVAAGEPTTAEAEILLDSTLYPPSGKWAITMYPFYHWEIHIDLRGTAPQQATFPITVERPLPLAPSLP